jgi:hypothetical protein
MEIPRSQIECLAMTDLPFSLTLDSETKSQHCHEPCLDGNTAESVKVREIHDPINRVSQDDIAILGVATGDVANVV